MGVSKSHDEPHYVWVYCLLLFYFPFYIPPCTTVFSLKSLFHNHSKLVNMQNEKGQNVELYMPRRWYAVSALTHLVVTGLTESLTLKIMLLLWFSLFQFVYTQINIARLDPKTGVATGEYDTVSLGGYIRSKVGSEMVCLCVG